MSLLREELRELRELVRRAAILRDELREESRKMGVADLTPLTAALSAAATAAGTITTVDPNALAAAIAQAQALLAQLQALAPAPATQPPASGT